MNAYLIVAKANAWEVDQHVGRAIEAGQPEREIEASGCGAGAATVEGRTRFRRMLKAWRRAA